MMSKSPDTIVLEDRDGLPDALRTLVEQYPRDMWEGHSNFDGLMSFWLQRHVMFRRLLSTIQEDCAQLESKDLSPDQYRHRVARLGNMFVSELHTHHHIEDHQYFPILQKMENSLTRGFEILDADHHALDRHLETFTTQANILLKSADNTINGEAMRFQENIEQIEGFMNRHLTDEEELVVPIVLKHGFEY